MFGQARENSLSGIKGSHQHPKEKWWRWQSKSWLQKSSKARQEELSYIQGDVKKEESRRKKATQDYSRQPAQDGFQAVEIWPEE